MLINFDFPREKKKPLPSKKDKFFGDPYGQSLDSVVRICVGIAAVLLLISVILIVSTKASSKKDGEENSPQEVTQEVIIVEEIPDDPVQLIDP